MNYKCNGYKRDPKDKIYIPFERDKISGVANPNINDVDLRPFSISRHDQGQTESCVANSTCKALSIKYAEKYGIENNIEFSRLDIYYGARAEMNPPQTHLDNGTNISLAMDVLRRFGICKESEWPFDISKINIPTSIMATRQSFLNKISGHFKIDSSGNQLIDDIILNLKNKNPVVFGMDVGSEFQSYGPTSDPINKLTNPSGGHATVIIGYLNGCFLCENSWGNQFGQNGFYFIDPTFLASVGSDFWVMQNDFDIYWASK